MQDRSNLGCFGILALIVAVYALWIVVLWVGVPLAVVGMVIAYSELQKSRVAESRKNIRKNNALALGAGSALLGIASIWGNLSSAEGPLAKMQGDDNPAVVAIPEEMPTAAECDARRAQIQTYGEIKAACERMTAGPGSTLAANACMSEEVRLLRNCGIDIEQSPF